MSQLQSEPPPATGPSRRAFPVAPALWLSLCLVHGAATAWLAFGLEKRFSPLGLFPILVGLFAGITLAGLMRLVQVGGRRTIVLGAVVALMLAVFGQHYFSYREQRVTAQCQAAQFGIAARAHPGLVRGSPPRPASGVAEYLRWQAIRGRPIAGHLVARGRWAWASWGLDGCLTLLAALLVIVPASRQPYCDRCRTWFRTVRRGTFTASGGHAIARVAGLEAPEMLHGGTYRIVDCQGGCGAAGLEICWQLPEGLSKEARGWVPAGDRTRLEEILSPAGRAPG
ncbi:MAG: hypothetical protein ACYC6Y_22530 [Thermoguttaceae bacterium]